MRIIVVGDTCDIGLLNDLKTVLTNGLFKAPEPAQADGAAATPAFVHHVAPDAAAAAAAASAAAAAAAASAVVGVSENSSCDNNKVEILLPEKVNELLEPQALAHVPECMAVMILCCSLNPSEEFMKAARAAVARARNTLEVAVVPFVHTEAIFQDLLSRYSGESLAGKFKKNLPAIIMYRERERERERERVCVCVCVYVCM